MINKGETFDEAAKQVKHKQKTVFFWTQKSNIFYGKVSSQLATLVCIHYSLFNTCN